MAENCGLQRTPHFSSDGDYHLNCAYERQNTNQRYFSDEEPTSHGYSPYLQQA